MKKAAPILIILSILAIIFVCSGGGIRTTEKTNFGGVNLASESWYYIVFKDVWLEKLVYGNVKEDVWVEPDRNKDKILVEIEPELIGTTITVVPTFFSRVFSGGIVYKAKKVIIWVSNDEEKTTWERWIRKSKEVYLISQEQATTPPPLRKITPK